MPKTTSTSTTTSDPSNFMYFTSQMHSEKTVSAPFNDYKQTSSHARENPSDPIDEETINYRGGAITLQELAVKMQEKFEKLKKIDKHYSKASFFAQIGLPTEDKAAYQSNQRFFKGIASRYTKKMFGKYGPNVLKFINDKSVLPHHQPNLLSGFKRRSSSVSTISLCDSFEPDKKRQRMDSPSHDPVENPIEQKPLEVTDGHIDSPSLDPKPVEVTDGHVDSPSINTVENPPDPKPLEELMDGNIDRNSHQTTQTFTCTTSSTQNPQPKEIDIRSGAISDKAIDSQSDNGIGKDDGDISSMETTTTSVPTLSQSSSSSSLPSKHDEKHNDVDVPELNTVMESFRKDKEVIISIRKEKSILARKIVELDETVKQYNQAIDLCQKKIIELSKTLSDTKTQLEENLTNLEQHRIKLKEHNAKLADYESEEHMYLNKWVTKT